MKNYKQYSNATVCKLHNRKVVVAQLKDEKDGVCINLCVVDGSTEPRAEHIVKKNKIVITAFSLSTESAEALVTCLQNELDRKKLYMQNGVREEIS